MNFSRPKSAISIKLTAAAADCQGVVYKQTAGDDLLKYRPLKMLFFLYFVKKLKTFHFFEKKGSNFPIYMLYYV